jgi:hypothetical protein
LARSTERGSRRRWSGRSEPRGARILRHGACYPSYEPLAIFAKAPIPAFPRHTRHTGEGALSRATHLVNGRLPCLSQSDIQSSLYKPVASLQIYAGFRRFIARLRWA